MLKMKIGNGKATRDTRAYFPLYVFIGAISLALLVAGYGIALLLGQGSGHIGPYIVGGLIVAMVIVTCIFLRQDELAATIAIAINLCVDWYLGYSLVSIAMAIGLLLIFFLGRSQKRPWGEPRALWLWALFLALAILPSIRGAITSYDALYYYPALVFGALVMFWLGTVIARDFTSVRRFFQFLAGFATLIALHINFQAVTGRFLFLTASQQNYLASVSGYQLGTTGVTRLASFFIQPDAGSAFLALTLFIPLGLFIDSSSSVKKVIFLSETLLILIALLLTYSAAAWVAAFVGVVVFLLLVGSKYYFAQFFLFITIAGAVLLLGFRTQINLLLQHAFDPPELMLRTGLWQTALQVIRAFPLTGVGLGRLAYLQRAEPYRVPAELFPMNNPHNSYLEWGAMAGLPVLFMFLALLAFALWQALHLWALLDRRTRPLLAAGITAVVVLSVDSWSFGSWTLPPLAASGWVLLGVISSPLLIRSLNEK